VGADVPVSSQALGNICQSIARSSPLPSAGGSSSSSGSSGKKGKGWASFNRDDGGPSSWVDLLMACLCVCGAALASGKRPPFLPPSFPPSHPPTHLLTSLPPSGLTIVLLSVDALVLEVKQRVGTEEEQDSSSPPSLPPSYLPYPPSLPPSLPPLPQV